VQTGPAESPCLPHAPRSGEADLTALGKISTTPLSRKFIYFINYCNPWVTLIEGVLTGSASNGG